MDGNATSDAELMVRLQSGDDGALSTLMSRWELPVRRYLVRMLRNEAVALDLAEEVFVRIYQHRDRFSVNGHFKAWLFAIATNLARTRHRWWTRHPTEVFPDESEFGHDTPDALRELGNPADALREQETIAMVKQAVATLPEDLRTATILFEYEELSHAEIAAALHCSAKAVETRLYRARKLLRVALASHFDYPSKATPTTVEARPDPSFP